MSVEEANKKTFREFRVQTFCSTSDPDFHLNEVTATDIKAYNAIEKGIIGTAKIAGKGLYKAGEIAGTAAHKQVKNRKAKKKKEKETENRKATNAELLKKRREQLDTAGLEKGAEIPLDYKEEIIHEQSEYIITAMKKIVRDGQYQKVKLADGKQISVDLMTAGAITKVYDALNPRNQIKFAQTLYKNRAGFQKMAGFAIKNVSY